MTMRLKIGTAWLLASALALPGLAAAQTQIANTKHNLTASGPGSFKTTEPAGLCVFCHTPHNAKPTRGLWNHNLSGQTYQLYSSSTLVASLGQPTGSSRLCLSCHDGTLALDSLLAPPSGAPLSLGRLTGITVLGNDLSREHPVSFTYNSALAQTRKELADPLTLPARVPLDAGQQLQCTSCHDPHEDKQPNFLRLDSRAGALCTACHKLARWSASAHASSSASWNGSGANPWDYSGAFATVADNACMSCHRPHNAAHAQRLLAQAAEPTNCTVCHGGTVASKNVEADFAKPSHHPVESDQWSHKPNENPLLMSRHVACSDCHNPHMANAANTTPPAIPGALRGVQGVTLSGTTIAEPNFGYEVCLKCHGLKEPTTAGSARQSATRNIRTKIDPGNASYHPVAASGVSTTLPGLEPGYTASSLIDCVSCHSSDDWSALGTAPRGAHGSRFEPILAAQYSASDPAVESAASYALCYQCHNRTFLITDQANTFPHQRHVVAAQAPCAACHDAHGSRQNQHLIDFMLRDKNGNLVVSKSSVQGRLEYTPLGAGHGQCYLSCHGVNHEPKSY